MTKVTVSKKYPLYFSEVLITEIYISIAMFKLIKIVQQTNWPDMAHGSYSSITVAILKRVRVQSFKPRSHQK